jgi:hypothetical protein
MLVVSLDSMVPAIHNQLRGRPYAHRLTLNTIRHCVARKARFKVQMTVWPRNYTTILDSVRELYDIGVRGFSFHCGSLEGVTDAQAERDGIMHVDPLAWRALCEQLLAFRDARHDALWHFNVPFLYFTESELREHMIGDDALTDAYLKHVERVERGEPSRKPLHACPALDVPQVYVYGNDGPAARGTVSLCNIHNPEGAGAYADYDPGQRRWRVRTDPRHNQMQRMVDSPHLCPALTHATGAASDRVQTEAGPLYHACRYIASNQMDVSRGAFGAHVYEDALAFYGQVARALDVHSSAEPDGEAAIVRVRRVTAGLPSLRARAEALSAGLGTVVTDAGHFTE